MRSFRARLSSALTAAANLGTLWDARHGGTSAVVPAPRSASRTARCAASCLAAAMMASGWLAVQEAGAAPCANALVREQQAATHLPDCRAYELVSPIDKTGQDVRSSFGELRSSDSGDAVTYQAQGSFTGADAKGATWKPRYLAARGPEGWTNRSTDSEQDPQIFTLAALGQMYFDLQPADSFTADLTAGAEQNFQVPLDPAHTPDAGVVSLYRRSYTADDYQMLTTAPAPLAPSFFMGLPQYVGATPDRQHIIFESPQPHTADAVSPGEFNLYEWDHGTVRLVGVLPTDEGGGPASGGSVAAGGISNFQFERNQSRGSFAHVISTDGSRIFFLQGNGITGRLYLRENGGTASAQSIWVSKSEHTTPDPSPQPVSFWGATPDGSKALFISSEALVDSDADTSADLYQFDRNAPAGARLTRLSAGTGPAGALGVVGTSSDQSSGYFAATGQLTADAPAGTAPKIYQWSSDGTLRFIAQLGAGDSDRDVWDPLKTINHPGLKTSRVSADGRYMLFTSHTQLTGYDNAGHNEFYLFDSDAAGQGLSCVSCREDGRAPTGDAALGDLQALTFGTTYQPRVMIPHGDSVRVFFVTSDQLDPDDANQRLDVYVYDGDTGQASLLSSGTDAYDSYFLDASPSGDDVFIVTRAALAGRDRDPLYDLYDVRVGGGFLEPAPSTPCTGDECRGSAGAPAAEQIGTATHRGPGNQHEPPPVEKPAPLPKVRIVKKQALTSVVLLGVKAPGSGRLIVSGGAVRRTTFQTRRAVTYTVRVKLTSSVRRRLAKGRAVRSVVRVAFVTSKGTQSTAKATLIIKGKRPNTKGHR